MYAVEIVYLMIRHNFRCVFDGKDKGNEKSHNMRGIESQACEGLVVYDEAEQGAQRQLTQMRATRRTRLLTLGC